MKKVALVFVLAVFAPSLVLGWLAVRSARDQQIVVAEQQTLLYRGVVEALAKDVRDFMGERQREFAQLVEALRRDYSSAELASRFDSLLLPGCPSAEVGFTVSADGAGSWNVLSPSLFDRPEARQFRLNNERFLGSCDSVAVYWNSPKAAGNLNKAEMKERGDAKVLATKDASADPRGHGKIMTAKESVEADSKITPDEAEFKDLVGDNFEGIVARFLQNKLKVLLWYRSVREPDLIYGAQLNLTNIIAGLEPLIRAPESIGAEAQVALLNDMDKVVAGRTAGPKPFVTSEIGSVLPHWRIAAYLNSPEVLTRTARTVKLVITLSVLAMIVAIALGSVLIVADLKQQLALARQKTDFVSNVSHELKTPLTSIRLFSELLSEGKVADDGQRKHFLQIIGNETARLTRLINNVLDFAQMERNEKKYNFELCDLKRVVRETAESYQTQLEAKGFTVRLSLPAEAIEVRADCDALAQVLVNLLSNAEKYSARGKEIVVELRSVRSTSGDARVAMRAAEISAELRVLDRGPGVLRGAEEKIFEQFYRANDSLSSGIQGSGLGLTLARQIVRAHHGTLRYEPREGGGSCFLMTVPMTAGRNENKDPDCRR